MPLNLSSPPDLPDLNSPGTYNQRVLDSFTYVFQTLVSELTALTPEDFFQVMSSLSDTTPEVLLKNGAHGLGAVAGVPAPGNDADQCLTPGFNYRFTTAGVNTPVSNPYGGTLQVFSGSSGGTDLVQVYVQRTASGMWMRGTTDGVNWTAWSRVYHTTNILGTASQSGGVPTGAIIERGGNANGEYVRLADGTQICTRQVTPDYSLHNSRQQYIYPASFSNVPKVWTGYSIQGNGNTSAWDVSDDLFVFGSLATQQWEVVQRKSGQPSSAVPINLIAIGRWF